MGLDAAQRWWGNVLRRIGPMLLLALVSIGITSQAHALTASSTAVGSSSNPAALPGSVTITVTVSGSGATPTGNVGIQFGDGQINGGVLDGSGKVTFFHVYAAAGTFTVTANYLGDGTYSGSSNTLPQIVSKANPTVSVTPNQQPVHRGSGRGELSGHGERRSRHHPERNCDA